jgi:ribosomal protein L28
MRISTRALRTMQKLGVEAALQKGSSA